MHNFRKKFILTADDFGLNALANQNILALAQAKKIDRVSIMMDGVFTSTELEELKSSGVFLDIHLATTPGKKGRRRAKESALLRGMFFLLRLFSPSMRSDAIALSWEKQIEQFYTLVGKYPDGINSHQHIHYFPPYFRIAIQLAQKKKIPFLRFGKETLITSNTNVYRILFWLHKKNRNIFLFSGLRSTDHLVSLDWVKKLPAFLSQKPCGSIEIVCHPELQQDFERIQKYF
jgi:predicted glycoside hydrolase/deacetylase ChbG (UPF0249 family)